MRMIYHGMGAAARTAGRRNTRITPDGKPGRPRPEPRAPAGRSPEPARADLRDVAEALASLDRGRPPDRSERGRLAGRDHRLSAGRFASPQRVPGRDPPRLPGVLDPPQRPRAGGMDDGAPERAARLPRRRAL